jgi:putative ABC transport system substrate-binding protein
VQEAARQIGRKLLVLRVRSTEAEIEAAFDGRACCRRSFDQRTGRFSRQGLVVAAATRLGVPSIYEAREWAAAGGLMSYSTSFIDSYHNVGIYTSRILKGARPANLPVMQPTKFELLINLQTARALKLTIPPGILAIANEVIE